MQGLIGKKVGMTKIFSKDSGRAIPVTVVQTGANVVHQVKTIERDGYNAAQLGFDPLPESKISKPLSGHFKKNGTSPTRVIREFRLDSEDKEIKSGDTVGVELLEKVRFVDVVGTSKGRGFSGTIRRHNFHRGRETHGNKNVREPGSIGANSYPARVFPGMKMPGHYGAGRVTAKNVEVVGVDKEEGLVFLKGSIPGCRNGIVYIKKNMPKQK